MITCKSQWSNLILRLHLTYSSRCLRLPIRSMV
jgi:hypothetical protein